MPVLASRMLAGLRVYAGAQHPHTGQNPKALERDTEKGSKFGTFKEKTEAIIGDIVSFLQRLQIDIEWTLQ